MCIANAAAGGTAVFLPRFASYRQNLAGLILDLARASRSIAAVGSVTTSVDVDRQDDSAERGRAFTGMCHALIHPTISPRDPTNQNLVWCQVLFEVVEDGR